MVKTEVSKTYIKLYNKLFDSYKLTPKELYFYTLLSMRRNVFLDYVEINLDVIAEVMPFLNHSRMDRNRNNAKKLLDKIVKLGIVEVEILSEQTNLLGIRLVDFGGYEEIDIELLFRTCDYYEFAILYLIKRFGKGELEKSYVEWGKMLKCGDTKVKDIIDNMLVKGILFMKSGDYYTDEKGDLKQEKNKYYLYPVNGKTNGKRESKIEVEAKNVIENIIDDIDYGNWNEWKSKLTEHDIYLYWLQKDKNEEFGLLCEKRRKILGKSFDFSNWDEKAQLKLRQEKEEKRKGKIEDIVYQNSKIIAIVDGEVSVLGDNWDLGKVEKVIFRKKEWIEGREGYSGISEYDIGKVYGGLKGESRERFERLAYEVLSRDKVSDRDIEELELLVEGVNRDKKVG